ncbi:MAG: HAMP domain-containing protein [Chloroflexi bacterium]|nr:HAMP domain-containing protein [Chloroflexota bacterium]
MRLSNIWQLFLAETDSVSVRTKIMGIVLGTILLLGVGMTWEVRENMVDTLSRQLEKRGISIARDVSARATDLILTNNSYALYELLRDTVENNEDVRYVIVLDQNGNVLVNTLGQAVPQDLIAANTAAPQDRYKLEILDTEEGLIRDIAVPVFEGRAGVVRVGMSDAGMRRSVTSATERLLAATALASLLGIIAAFLLTSILTKPVRELVEASRAVAQGDLARKARIWARDEVGQLGEAFNSMTTALAISKRDIDEFNKQLVRRNEELSALWAELSEKEELRSQLLVKVMSAQEEERKRIARELHDETSQSLTSLIVGLKVLEQCDPAEVGAVAAELRAQASKTLDAVHDLALELRPSTLDDLGLVAALDRHVREYARRHDCEVDFQATGIEGVRLPSQTELAMYRIIQEALTNTAKYAEARTVSVTLERRASTVVAIVEDDGRGFDVKALLESRSTEGKLGLFGMQERAALIGGRLTIESEPGAGTTVFVEAPLELERSIA